MSGGQSASSAVLSLLKKVSIHRRTEKVARTAIHRWQCRGQNSSQRRTVVALRQLIAGAAISPALPRVGCAQGWPAKSMSRKVQCVLADLGRAGRARTNTRGRSAGSGSGALIIQRKNSGLRRSVYAIACHRTKLQRNLNNIGVRSSILTGAPEISKHLALHTRRAFGACPQNVRVICSADVLR
jgi:hypothetical protein